ncbi:hypothetical protein AURDEDRAFT_113283 [Auricularia subglabra TFB-10046 SS5]|nr:hypothetical protein AURDEDRAFT_113283 [Auricularia subglabra TFB-10046 SS5]
MASAVHPSFELAEPTPPPYHLHEALQRILLQEMCRLLDTDEIPLNIYERRAINSRFNTLPSAVRPPSTSASRKRGSEGPDRQDGGPRPRLSP